jgi:drug/metabolite transporter (DMT)-like permease
MRWFKNKRLNTILFLIVASIMNLVIIALLLLIALFILDRFVNPESPLLGLYFGLAFLFSIGGSFYIYTFVIKSLTVRLRLEENLDPIFKQKRRYKKDRSK